MKEDDNMTQAELYLILSLLADTIENKAENAKEAAEIVRKKAKEVKPK